MTPEERFAELVYELVELPGVTPPGAGRGFGSSALRIRGRIFAMLAHDRLVVKLPAARVDELVAAGDGVRFDGNKGVPMKEWFSVDPDGQLSWRQLAHEALVFVAPKFEAPSCAAFVGGGPHLTPTGNAEVAKAIAVHFAKLP